MKGYRIDITERRITECSKVLKGSYDAILVKQYGSFAHIEPDSLQITAYLCKAVSQTEARIKASAFLNDLNIEML